MDKTQRIKTLANVIASTLAEVPADPIGTPEGHIYAAVMGRFSLEEFQTALDVLAKVGLIERKAGPTIHATAKCRQVFAALKSSDQSAQEVN